MTILNYIKIQCPNSHVFTISFPRSINTWISPELTQDLLDGKFYKVECDECKAEITLRGEMIVNTPKGIFLTATGPKEVICEFLFNTEVIDEMNNLFSPEEIRQRLDYNMKMGEYAQIEQIKLMKEMGEKAAKEKKSLFGRLFNR